MKTAQELSEEMKQTAKYTLHELFGVCSYHESDQINLFVESIIASCTLEIGLMMKKELLEKSTKVY